MQRETPTPYADAEQVLIQKSGDKEAVDYILREKSQGPSASTGRCATLFHQHQVLAITSLAVSAIFKRKRCNAIAHAQENWKRG
eukprot:2835571-Pleurochrysis_carterae.AAC.3